MKLEISFEIDIDDIYMYEMPKLYQWRNLVEYLTGQRSTANDCGEYLDGCEFRDFNCENLKVNFSE